MKLDLEKSKRDSDGVQHGGCEVADVGGGDEVEMKRRVESLRDECGRCGEFGVAASVDSGPRPR